MVTCAASPIKMSTEQIRFKMPNWYYDKKALRKTPSYIDGITTKKEMRYRREGARLILKVGTKLGLKYDTMATGIVYFHRFYMFHSFKQFPRFRTGCCCLFLAGKVEETPKKCKQIINTASEFLTDKQFQSFGDDPKEEVMTMERILLKTIKFDLQVSHPYAFLLKYAKAIIGDREQISSMVQMAWTFINDSLCTTLCLQWEPEIIAIAVIYLAGKLSKFDIADWQGRTVHQKQWWEAFASDICSDLLEDICHQILDLYSTPNPDTFVDSPPDSPVPSPRRASRPPSPPLPPPTKVKEKRIDSQPIPTLDQSKKLQAPPLPPMVGVMAAAAAASAPPPLPKEPPSYFAPPPSEPPPLPSSNQQFSTLPPLPPLPPNLVHPISTSLQVGGSSGNYSHPPPPTHTRQQTPNSVQTRQVSSTYPVSQSYYMMPEQFYYNNAQGGSQPPPGQHQQQQQQQQQQGHQGQHPQSHQGHPQSHQQQQQQSIMPSRHMQSAGGAVRDHYARQANHHHPYMRPAGASSSGHFGAMMPQQRR